MDNIELHVKLVPMTLEIKNLKLFIPGGSSLDNVMPIPIIIIPHYVNPEYLVRCVESIDHPVEKLVIIQTGPDNKMPKIDREHVHIKLPDAGFQTAINLGVKVFPAPWWMLVSNDIQFAPGDLRKMACAAQHHANDFVAFFGNHTMAYWIWTPRGISKIGLYDENFHPAYCEDTEWLYRRSLTDEQICMVNDVHALHGSSEKAGADVGSTPRLNPDLKAKNEKTFVGNVEYYTRKWGGQMGSERFKTPFNEPLPIDYWKFDPAMRVSQHWGNVKP